MARAAAFLALAVGLSDLLSVLAPRVEPMTVFLAAVAIVAALDGMVVGLFMAAGAAIAHAYFVLPAADRLGDRSWSVALLGAAVAIAIGIVQSVRRRRRIEQRTMQTPLLSGEVFAAPAHAENSAEVLTAIETLRGDLSAAFAELDRTRLAGDERAALLQSEIAGAREDARAAVAERRELDARIADLTDRLARAYEIANEATHQRDAQAAGAREREARLQEAHDETRRTADQRVAVMQREVDRARSEAASASRAVEQLRERSQTADARAESAERRVAVLAAEMETLRKALDAETERVKTERGARELQGATLQRRLDEAMAHARYALQEAADLKTTVASLQTQLDDAQAELVAERTGHATEASEESKALRNRVGELETELGATEKEHLAAMTALAAAQLEAASVEQIRAQVAELDAQLSTVISDRDAAISALEDARHEASAADRIRARMNELESELAESESERNSVVTELETLRVEVKLADALRSRVAELESNLAEAVSNRGTLDRVRIAELESQLVDAVRARSEAEKAVAAAAERAERADSLRHEVEDAARSLAADHSAHIKDLAAKLDAAENELAAEKAAHQARDHDFNAKLQNIVNHIAMDHEADLGQALMEKEAAKAEVRGLNMRMSSLQQKLEEDRATFIAAQDKWKLAHQALTVRLKQTEERLRQTETDSAALLAKTRAAAQGEIDALRGTIDDLRREVMRRTPPSADTLPGVKGHRAAPVDESSFAFAIVSAPPPADAARPRILVVHPDLELRAAAKESLERIGYMVETAADGLEGLRMAIARPPDVVVADASMPKMDGRELCQLLKSQERTAGIKVVLLTRNDEERRADRELEPDDVLRKPVKFDTLRSTLAHLAPVPN